MQKKRSAFVLIVFFCLMTALAMEEIQDRRKSITYELEKVNDAIEVIEEMVGIPEEGIQESLFYPDLYILAARLRRVPSNSGS